jgi:hypothetical protein
MIIPYQKNRRSTISWQLLLPAMFKAGQTKIPLFLRKGGVIGKSSQSKSLIFFLRFLLKVA